MKAVNKLLVLAMVSVSQQQTVDNTGVDCSDSTKMVCDRDSECCGTGVPVTVAENAAQLATTNIKVCNKKFRSEI